MQVNQDHLDAEVVAAWLDGSLDRAARAEAEAHAADCDRCQAVLATMVRIEPEPAHRKAWFTAPVRWALPLATAAAALSIWVAVNRDAGVPDAPHVTTATPASPGAPEQAKADRALDSAAAAQVAPPAAPRVLQDQKAPSPPAAARAASSRKDETRRKEAAQANVTPTAVAETVSVEQLARERALPKAAAAPASSAPPPAPPSQTQAQAQAQTQTQRQTQTRISAASPPVDTAAARSEQRQERAGIIALSVREFASPDLAARWRLGGDGTIQRSTDAGKTWVPQTSGVTTELLSASAPAANICWIVGRFGVVLLSTDGATWRRVAFPELVDLRSVTATDARTASVTTADGRIFRTTDGGITWVP
jgi:hypothetical protein